MYPSLLFLQATVTHTASIIIGVICVWGFCMTRNPETQCAWREHVSLMILCRAVWVSIQCGQQDFLQNWCHPTRSEPNLSKIANSCMSLHSQSHQVELCAVNKGPLPCYKCRIKTELNELSKCISNTRCDKMRDKEQCEWMGHSSSSQVSLNNEAQT